MNLRTPLARARGLGSAKEGVDHWWIQRLTAAALVPLMLWLVIALVSLAGADYGEVVAWIRSPVVAVLLVLLIAAGFHHAQLGVQVVIEDYVHNEWLKVFSVVLVKFAAAALGVAAAFSVLKIAFSG